MQPNLESAIALAAMAHNGQVDKGGAPYILHPLRVMAALASRGLEVQMAGVLHDVPEDCPFMPITTLWQMGYPSDVCNALDALTKRRDEDYETYISRCGANMIARMVKVEDLKDNLNLSRIRNIGEEDLARERKYRKALDFLTGRRGMEVPHKFKPWPQGHGAWVV